MKHLFQALVITMVMFYAGVWTGAHVRPWVETHLRAFRKWVARLKARYQAPRSTVCLVPFTAGRLTRADGTFRADAFGFRIPANERLPKPGEYIWVRIGEDAKVFTVKMCETLTRMTKNFESERSPEVYVLIKESLTGSQILACRKRRDLLKNEEKPVIFVDLKLN